MKARNNMSYHERVNSLHKAIANLERALAQSLSDDEFILDATIQRFEIAYELLWKCLRLKLLQHGIEANSPRKVFQEAYQLKWIEEEKIWLDMIQDRNLTTHTYLEELALQVRKHAKLYLPYIKQLVAEHLDI